MINPSDTSLGNMIKRSTLIQEHLILWSPQNKANHIRWERVHVGIPHCKTWIIKCYLTNDFPLWNWLPMVIYICILQYILSLIYVSIIKSKALLLLKYKETHLDKPVTLLTWSAENGVRYLITNASVSSRNPIFQRRFAEWRVIPLFCNSGRKWLNIMNIAEILDPCAHL